MEESIRPDWIVTSPPYKNVLNILQRALRVARFGVAFKLRLGFLEPTKSRGTWLNENPPHALVVLLRATYRGRRVAQRRRGLFGIVDRPDLSHVCRLFLLRWTHDP